MENNPPRSNFVERIALKKYLNNFHDLCKKKLFPAKRLLLSNQPLMLMHPLSNTRFLPQSQYIYSISGFISIHFQYIMNTSQYISMYHQYISIHVNKSSIHLQYIYNTSTIQLNTFTETVPADKNWTLAAVSR